MESVIRIQLLPGEVLLLYSDRASVAVATSKTLAPNASRGHRSSHRAPDRNRPVGGVLAVTTYRIHFSRTGLSATNVTLPIAALSGMDQTSPDIVSFTLINSAFRWTFRFYNQNSQGTFSSGATSKHPRTVTCNDLCAVVSRTLEVGAHGAFVARGGGQLSKGWIELRGTSHQEETIVALESTFARVFGRPTLAKEVNLKSKEMALDVLSREVERMGPGWALLPVNHSFNAIPTYPPSLPLPSTLASVLLPPSSPQFPFPRSTHPSTPSIPPTPSPSLGNLASFRSRSRVPSLSWAAPGRAILRSSQPLVGMLGARCFEDEKLITEAVRVATASALAIDRRRHTVDFSELDDGWAGVGLVANSPPRSGFQMPPSSDYVPFCIMDLRSYTAALGQMGVTGGGYENAENYPTRGTPVLFLSLGNIHAVSTAHAALLKGLASKDVEGWYGRVESSGWHGLVAEVLRASWEVADRVGSGAVTLVHCTDGWDRTSQVVALAQIILDPFYRTMEGLKTLIQKEFITYGHPFRARHPTPTITLYNQSTSPPLQPLFSTQFQSAEPPPGRRSSPVVSSQPSRERTSAQIAPEYVPPPHSPSPIFLLFLTCVRHLILEHSTRFEYHTGLLLVLARAVSGDGPFGDFLFNNMLERQIIGAGERTGSVWRWIDDRSWLFHNTHYDPVEADLARGTKAGWFPNGVQWSDEMALHFPSVDQNPVGLWDDLYLEDLQPIVRLFSLPPSAALLLPPYARELLSKRNIEIAQGLHRLAAARARRTARSMLTSWRTHVLSRRKSAWEANVIGRWAAEHIVSVAVARVGELDRNKPRGLEEFALHVSPKSVGMGLRATRVRRKVGADGKVKEVELGIEEDGPPRLRRSLVDEHPLESSQGQGAPANSSAENGWVTMGREAAPDVEIVFFLEEADWRDIEYSPAANPASAIERQMSDAMRDIL